MDKTAIMNAKTELQTMNFLTKGMRPIHKQYGLWICKFCRKLISKSYKPEEYLFRQSDYYNLSHMFGGKGWYCVPDGSIQKIEPGDGVMISPGFVHKYAGDCEKYIEDAISFKGPLADNLFNAGIIKNGIIKLGEVRRLLPIIDMVLDGSSDSQIKANIALENLLIEVYFENKNANTSAINPFFEKLLEEIKKRPDKWWSVSAMAEFCNLSLTQFNRLFKIKTEMTPKNFIDNIKMQLASEMLLEKSRSIKAIAVKLGYPDPYHFSRRFKQLKGYSPEMYRERSCI